MRLENDLDYRDDLHGASGPVPLRRWTAQELVPEQKAFYYACRAALWLGGT